MFNGPFHFKANTMPAAIFLMQLHTTHDKMMFVDGLGNNILHSNINFADTVNSLL